MSLDVYFRKDIANALEALYMTGQGHNETFNTLIAKLPGAQQRTILESAATYRRGYEDGLRAAAAAFGIRDGGSDIKRLGS
ncbi:MAG: hypothetical protein DRP52_02625 [Planctomycetota bacterium]|nr:MAG: hypothetical protein DRP52_02625 [Planctomycetota bacterium]